MNEAVHARRIRQARTPHRHPPLLGERKRRIYERGTGPKSQMEGLKGCQEVRDHLTVCICVSYCSVSRVPPFRWRKRIPFYRGRGSLLQGRVFRMYMLLSLVAHVYLTSFFILMSTNEDKRLQYC